MKTLVYLVVGLSFLGLSHTKPVQAQAMYKAGNCAGLTLRERAFCQADSSGNYGGLTLRERTFSKANSIETIRPETVVISSSNEGIRPGQVVISSSNEGIRPGQVVISSSKRDKIDTDQQINLNYRLVTGGRKAYNADHSAEEAVVESQQTDSPETDYNWMTCYIEGHSCSEINLHNIVEIQQSGTKVVFFHNIAYKTSNLTTVCSLGNLKYGRHCLTPDFLKKHELPEDVGPNLFD